MCLSSIKETFPPNDNMMMCYKVFEKTNNSKYKYRNNYFSGKLKCLGEHYKSNNVPITNIVKNFNYESGYHCYTNLKDALFWFNKDEEVICKVLVWDIRAIGMQGETDKGNTIVAKNMMIMEEVK